MKNWILLFAVFGSLTSFCQKKVELFDLVKKLVQDSSEFSDVGDWAVGSPSTYRVKWQSDRIIMSDDIKINFFRKGSADISVKGITPANPSKPMKWNVMLMGPRSGFTSFIITSPEKK
jgi:hypothetical protein